MLTISERRPLATLAVAAALALTMGTGLGRPAGAQGDPPPNTAPDIGPPRTTAPTSTTSSSPTTTGSRPTTTATATTTTTTTNPPPSLAPISTAPATTAAPTTTGTRPPATTVAPTSTTAPPTTARPATTTRPTTTARPVTSTAAPTVFPIVATTAPTSPTTAARSTLTLIPSAPATPVPTAGPTSVVVQLTDAGDPPASDPATSDPRRQARSTTVTSAQPPGGSDPGATLSTALVPPGAPLSAAGSPPAAEAKRLASTTSSADPAGPETMTRGGDPLTLDVPAGCDDVTGVTATPTDTADGGAVVALTRLTSSDPTVLVLDTTRLAVGRHILRLDCRSGPPAVATVGIFRQNGAARGEGNSIVLAGGMGLASMAALVGRPQPRRRRADQADGADRESGTAR